MFPFEPSPNFGKSNQNQRQPYNSNTRSNQFLPLTEGPFAPVLSPATALRQNGLFGSGPTSISVSPAALEANRPLFSTTASTFCGEPAAQFGGPRHNGQFNGFGQCESLMGQRNGNSVNDIFGGVAPAANSFGPQPQSRFSAVDCDSFGHVHTQRCLDQNIVIIRQTREDMRGLAERLKVLEEYLECDGSG